MPEEGVVEGLNLPVFQQPESMSREGRTSQSSDEGAIGANGIVDCGAERGNRAKEKEVKGPEKPFLLSEGLAPVPAKLVSQILKAISWIWPNY